MVWYNFDMNKDERKDIIDKLSKIADIVNKKLIALLAIDGGVGAYAVKFIEQNNIFGYALGIIFIVVSVGVAYNYNELNRLKKNMEEF
ncbi:MAG: hypothetical protein QG565_199 [Campylobacterota bacterium]|nr:hypothetical protein [Campylobacterota bacterium]MDQ1433168.1 hypothetical protein [Patescibacteria group bacterium]